MTATQKKIKEKQSKDQRILETFMRISELLWSLPSYDRERIIKAIVILAELDPEDWR